MSDQTPEIFTEEIDTLRGGADADTFTLRNNSDQLNVLLLTPPATHQGSSQAEEMLGTEENDVMYGRQGNDTISSFTGDDFLNGELGDDLLFAGRNNDILIGDSGEDTMFGDRGEDTLYGGSAGDVMFGNNEDDTVFGDRGDDTIYGGQGDDELTGGTGSDLILGDRGEDTLTGITGRGKGYTLIEDFDPQEDTIQLVGNADTYELVDTGDIETNSSVNLPSGTGIIYEDSDGSKELIAVIEGDTSLDLNANYFDFF
ncbi:calcium-binding protein [Capilliphycus salinus ALCB114379]|uniref:calcium-binding protein n=1 Tax=Capilliphycus salinus TaxID=2768948 RepID=UPI0039A4E464